jgi:hypothetical protein
MNPFSTVLLRRNLFVWQLLWANAHMPSTTPSEKPSTQRRTSLEPALLSGKLLRPASLRLTTTNKREVKADKLDEARNSNSGKQVLWQAMGPTPRPTSSAVKKISFVAFGDGKEVRRFLVTAKSIVYCSFLNLPIRQMIFLLHHILVPYRKADRYCLNKQLRELNQDQMGFKFMVHVGDLKQGQEPCYESSFLDVAEMFSHVSNALNYDPRNCFFVPGDNEFQECQNRTKAWGWWMKRKSHSLKPRRNLLDGQWQLSNNKLILTSQISAMA